MRKRERRFVAFRMLTFFMPVAILLLMALSSCSSSSDGDEDWGDDPDMEVCKHVAKVANAVEEYYFRSETLEDMVTYLDDIKNIRYVEDAYESGNELFVKIKDYGKISFSFYPRPNDTQKEMMSRENVKRMSRRALPTQFNTSPIIEAKKVAFISQTQNDEDFNTTNAWLDGIRQLYKMCDFDVSQELIKPDVEFFRDGIFDYDIILLLTHGGYDKDTKTHSFLTSEEINSENSEFNKSLNKYIYKGIDTKYVYFTEYKETRGEKEVGVWYAVVTEDWIDSGEKHFNNDGKAIVFNAACSSMKGHKTSTKDSISHSVSNIFLERGAGVYFGYDEIAGDATYGGICFLDGLLSGKSIENAIKDMPPIFIHRYRLKDDTHKKNYWSDLVEDYDPQNPDIKRSRIFNPIRISYKDSSTETEINFTLHTETLYFNEFYNSYFDKEGIEKSEFGFLTYLPNNSPNQYGYFLSKTGNLNDAVQLCKLYLGSEGFSYEYPVVSFEYTLTYKSLMTDALIAPGTTYYYWAYFYDGHDYYFSERGDFTTKSVPSEGSGSVPDVPGSDF